MYVNQRMNNASNDLSLIMYHAGGQWAKFVANLPRLLKSHLMPVDCRSPERLFELSISPFTSSFLQKIVHPGGG